MKAGEEENLGCDPTRGRCLRQGRRIQIATFRLASEGEVWWVPWLAKLEVSGLSFEVLGACGAEFWRPWQA